MSIRSIMIKDFLILNFIGKNDKIGLKFDNNFFTHDFNNTIKNNDKLTLTILNFIVSPVNKYWNYIYYYYYYTRQFLWISL